MSNLRLIDPTFGDTMESAFRRFLSPVSLDMDAPELQMRMDVSEKDNHYEIKADLPGVKKEDINIRIDGNVVQIGPKTKTVSNKITIKAGNIRMIRFQIKLITTLRFCLNWLFPSISFLTLYKAVLCKLWLTK